MSSLQDTNKAIIQHFNKAFLQGKDAQVFHDTVAPDFVNHSAMDPQQTGPQGAFVFFTKVLHTAFPDIEVTIHDQIAEDDKVVTRKSYTATHQGPFMGIPPTGRRVNFTVMDIIRLRDGKYVEHWANADMATLRQQLTAPAAA